MNNLSDRQHDAFDNPAKGQCRAGNLRVLREAAHLIWEDDSRARLCCDWCELMGATGLLTLDTLEREGVLAASGFVGVDLDPARIDGFRRGRPDLKWIAGNLYEHLHASEMANVGILNLDEYGEIGSRSALFWNQDLDSVSRRGQKRGEALRRHADMVASVLQSCLPRRELTSAMLLSAESEAAIDAGDVGVFGAFEIYRGKTGGHRMANLRVILR
jgi:hypothetical protein